MNLISTMHFLLVLITILSAAERNIQPILLTTDPIPLHHGQTVYEYNKGTTPDPDTYYNIDNTAVRLIPELSTTQPNMIINVDQKTRDSRQWSGYYSSASRVESRANRVSSRTRQSWPRTDLFMSLRETKADSTGTGKVTNVGHSRTSPGEVEVVTKIAIVKTDVPEVPTDVPGVPTVVSEVPTVVLVPTGVPVDDVKVQLNVVESVTDNLHGSSLSTTGLHTMEPFRNKDHTTVSAELPEILEEFATVTAHFGGSVSIVCTGKGKEVKSVQIKSDWLIGDDYAEDSNDSDPREDVKEARLTISSVLLKHGGLYTCAVTDSVGTNSKPIVFLEVVDLCSEVQCETGTVCTADPDRGTTKCEKLCEECLEPIAQMGLCGDDCLNYGSICEINRFNCRFDSSIVSIGQGFCYDLQPQLINHTLSETVLDVTESFELFVEFVNVPKSKIKWFKINDQEEADLFYEGASYKNTQPGLALAGRYIAEATACNGVTLRTPIITILKEKDVEPSNVCSVFGDPNIITFDGYTYTYKGTCHHVLAMDCETAQWFVYGGFQQTGPHSSSLYSVTLYSTRTSIELQQGWVVNEMGTKQFLTEGVPYITGDIELLFNGIHLQASFLSSSNTPKIYWDGISAVHISLPMVVSTTTCGLCGNNDGNPTNDIAGSRRGIASTSTEFAQSWMLSSATSNCPLFKAPKIRNVKKNIKSAVCSDVLQSIEVEGCKLSSSEYKFILNSCVSDTISTVTSTGTMTVKCAIGEMYSERCYIKSGVRSISSWQRNNSCPDKCGYRKIAVELGCPQHKLPYDDC